MLLYFVAQIIPTLSIKLFDLPWAKSGELIIFCFWFFPLALPVILLMYFGVVLFGLSLKISLWIIFLLNWISPLNTT